VSRKVGQGEVDGYTSRVQTAWLDLDLDVDKPWLVPGGMHISVLFGINGLRNKPSHLVGPLFPVFRTCFQLPHVDIFQVP